MFKRSKKGSQIFVDEKKGHLFFGERDLRLLMLRPIELIEFSEFAGGNAEDILQWVGKTIGKYFLEKVFHDEDWTGVDLSVKKKVINQILEDLESLGYGVLTSVFKKDRILISAYEPLSEDERDNIMAKNICLLYEGIFNGLLEALEIDVDSHEIKCYLKGEDACTFEFELLIDEFDDKDVDDEPSATPISDFLGNF